MISSLKFVVSIGSVSRALGHSFLADPPARNVIANQAGQEYCPQCLQSGGPPTVQQRADGHWPSKDRPTSHGLCGDPVQGSSVPSNWRDEPYLVPTAVQKTYIAGSIVEFMIGVTAHHQGHYEFRICDSVLDGQTMESRERGQECLNTWLLERAPLKQSCSSDDDHSDADCQPLDVQHPERWYLPPQGTQADKTGIDTAGLPHMKEVHRMRYKIPEELSCTHCTLQWYWSTGNSCLYDSHYLQYFADLKTAGWPAEEWCSKCNMPGNMPGSGCVECCSSSAWAEEFWNCADIEVLPAGEELPSLAPEQQTESATTKEPEAATKEPEAETEPATTLSAVTTPTSDPADGVACGTPYGQCGGDGWAGTTCCESGLTCEVVTQWFHRCMRPGQSLLSSESKIDRRSRRQGFLHPTNGMSLLRRKVAMRQMVIQQEHKHPREEDGEL